MGFGGWITWHNRAPDEIAVFDDLFVDQIFGPFEETVAAGDNLYIHSGLGCLIGTGATTEAGIFNSASSGDMLCRSVFAVKNKAAGDTLTLTWVLTFSV